MSDNYYTRISIINGQTITPMRLDKLLALLWPNHSRVAMQTLIRDGGVILDGVVCRRLSQAVAGGSELALDLHSVTTASRAADCAPEAIALTILHEDDDIIVVNKPVGMVTHPGHGNRYGTLQAALLHHHPAAAALPRGGIVHRLDKDTGGLLVAAKTTAAQTHLIAQFKTRQSIGREYLALVHGEPPATGVIRQPIGRGRQTPTRMAVRSNGKEATTRYVVEKQWRGFALLRCHLETGRTHQIRVHLEHSGYPLVGDTLYRRRTRPHQLPIHRQALHAVRLRLLHPADERPCAWDCPIPRDMQEAVHALNQHGDNPK